MLLLRKADVTLVDESGNSALSDAAYRYSTDSLELLLEAGADADSRNHEGQTPLMRALMHRNPHERTVALLLKAGADIDAVPSNGEPTPLQSASELENLGTDRLILRAGGQRKREKPPNHIDMKEGVKNNSTTWNDALARAIARGCDAEIVELLIDNRADLNSTDSDDYFSTPLLGAIYGDHISIIRLLLDAELTRTLWGYMGLLFNMHAGCPNQIS